jgi:cytochrome c oxidase cbb3-type subunit 4
MNYELIASSLTVVSFITFAGIVLWALSKRRNSAFAEAAQAPFALRDEFDDETASKGQAS